MHLGVNKCNLEEERVRRYVMRKLSKHDGQMMPVGAAPIAYLSWKLLDVSEIWVDRGEGFLDRITEKVLSFHERMSSVRKKNNEEVKNACKPGREYSESVSEPMRRQSAKPPTTFCCVECLNLLQLKIGKSYVYTNMGLGWKSIVENVGRKTVRTNTMRRTFSYAEKSLNPSLKVEVAQGMLEVVYALPPKVFVKLMVF